MYINIFRELSVLSIQDDFIGYPSWGLDVIKYKLFDAVVTYSVADREFNIVNDTRPSPPYVESLQVQNKFF